MAKKKTGTDLSTLQNRVSYLVEVKYGGSVARAVEATGLNKSTLKRLLRGQTSRLNKDGFVRLSVASGASVSWLKTGRGKGPRRVERRNLSIEEPRGDWQQEWADVVSALPVNDLDATMIHALAETGQIAAEWLEPAYYPEKDPEPDQEHVRALVEDLCRAWARYFRAYQSKYGPDRLRQLLEEDEAAYAVLAGGATPVAHDLVCRGADEGVDTQSRFRSDFEMYAAGLLRYEAEIEAKEIKQWSVDDLYGFVMSYDPYDTDIPAELTKGYRHGQRNAKQIESLRLTTIYCARILFAPAGGKEMSLVYRDRMKSVLFRISQDFRRGKLVRSWETGLAYLQVLSRTTAEIKRRLKTGEPWEDLMPTLDQVSRQMTVRLNDALATRHAEEVAMRAAAHAAAVKEVKDAQRQRGTR